VHVTVLVPPPHASCVVHTAPGVVHVDPGANDVGHVPASTGAGQSTTGQSQ
jgi:hypothetical protein